MPIYEYQCEACGQLQEVMQKISAPAPDACPQCGKGPLVKQMSRTAFVLKGEGWYVTDFRDKKKPAAPAPAADAAKPVDTMKPVESKPAEAPAPAPAAPTSSDKS